MGLLSIPRKNIAWYYLLHHFEKIDCSSKWHFHFQSLLVSNVIFNRRLFLTFSFIKRERLALLATKICFKMNKTPPWSIWSHTLLTKTLQYSWDSVKVSSFGTFFCRHPTLILRFPRCINGILKIKTDWLIPVSLKILERNFELFTFFLLDCHTF